MTVLYLRQQIEQLEDEKQTHLDLANRLAAILNGLWDLEDIGGENPKLTAQIEEAEIRLDENRAVIEQLEEEIAGFYAALDRQEDDDSRYSDLLRGRLH